MDVTIDWAFADARVPGRPVSKIAGDRHRGRDPRQRAHLHQFRGAPLGRRPPHRAPARARGDHRRAGSRRRARSTGRSRTSPSAAPPGSRTATGRRARPPAPCTSTPARDSLALATDVVFDPLVVRRDPARLPHAQDQGRAARPIPERGDAEPARRGRRPDRRPGRRPGRRLHHRAPAPLGRRRAPPPVRAGQPRHPHGADALHLAHGRAPRHAAASTPLRAPEGSLELALTRSRIREWTIDSLFGRGGVHDSVIRVDTAYAEWKGARASGGGTPGLARAARTGGCAFDLAADSLIGFDSLLLAMTQQKRDTSAEARPLTGRAEGRVDLAGSLDSLQADGSLRGRRLRVAADPLAAVHRDLNWLGGAAPAPHRARGRRLDPGPAVGAPAVPAAPWRLRRLARLERRHQPRRRLPLRRHRALVPARRLARCSGSTRCSRGSRVRQYRLEAPVTVGARRIRRRR